MHFESTCDGGSVIILLYLLRIGSLDILRELPSRVGILAVNPNAGAANSTTERAWNMIRCERLCWKHCSPTKTQLHKVWGKLNRFHWNLTELVSTDLNKYVHFLYVQVIILQELELHIIHLTLVEDWVLKEESLNRLCKDLLTEIVKVDWRYEQVRTYHSPPSGYA
jgi:hypothetical protein